MKPLINDFTINELTGKITELGEPAYRAKQIWQMIYKQLVSSPADFSNMPKDLRQKLDEQYCFEPLTVEKDLKSSDGQTNKLLFRLWDDRLIESVLMRYRERNTICISTQVGCPMNCAFCATGQMGFTRNLSAGEIVAQILYFAIDDLDPGKPYSFEVKTGLGTNTVRVEKGSVSVSGSDCKNKICVYHGKISKAGESIICAPHKLIIRITGSSGPDAVV